ncbi:MAG TPA: hypothetical protein VG367_07380 [Mucilaginibacter sp.]|jgi:hypothetical protein|nr:hypothetical protein [Mucilaginibacter sp.]
MKRLFTKIACTGLFAALILTAASSSAQTYAFNEPVGKKAAKADSGSTITATTATPKAQDDTTWKPQRRLWGYTFGDFYYDAHADATNRGAETMYNGVPTYRNAFQFRRLYLGYDYEITKKFKAEVLLASEPNANTGVNGTTAIQNGDNLVDNKMAFWIKNFNLRTRDIWKGTDFIIGEMSTPGFALNEPGTNGPTSLSETTWAYRSVEKTITDFHKNNSYDVGAALQGTFDPATKNFGYVLMVGNNSQASLLGASNPNTGFFKIFYGDIWGKFLNQHLYVDIYADYLKTADNSNVNNTILSPATLAVGPQEHNMLKLFVSYLSKPFNFGAEIYTQNINNAVVNTGAALATATAPTTTAVVEKATVSGLSFWVRGAIAPNWNYFARFDSYNPDTKFNSANEYQIVNTNYGNYTPLTKEQFWTAGIDYNPTKNVHFEPNFWLVDYKDNRDSGTPGSVASDHTLVFRFTFFYTFGK